MSEKISAELAHFIFLAVLLSGCAGVALPMAIEPACVPQPKGIIMPFAGYLVHAGRLRRHATRKAG